MPLGSDNDSWVLRNDLFIYHNGSKLGSIRNENIDEGDVIVRYLTKMLWNIAIVKKLHYKKTTNIFEFYFLDSLDLRFCDA